LFAIVILLRQSNRLGLLIPHLHAQTAPLRRDAQLAVAETAHQIEGLSRRLFVRQTRRVRAHALLDRRAHLISRAEEAVSRHEPAEALMWPLKVVAVDEETQALLAVRVVGEHRLAQPLVPQRLPEALHFAERLRMLRPALDVTNALPT